MNRKEFCEYFEIPYGTVWGQKRSGKGGKNKKFTVTPWRIDHNVQSFSMSPSGDYNCILLFVKNNKRGRKNFVVQNYGGRMFQYYVFQIKNGTLKKVCMIGDQILDDPVHIGKINHDYYYNDKKTSEKVYKKYFKKYVYGTTALSVI